MILSLDQVRQLLGVSQRTIMRLVSIGRFPKPIDLADGRNHWRESDVKLFVEGLEERAPIVRKVSSGHRLFDDTESLAAANEPNASVGWQSRKNRINSRKGGVP